jgi:hypothetical protein
MKRYQPWRSSVLLTQMLPLATVSCAAPPSETTASDKSTKSGNDFWSELSVLQHHIRLWESMGSRDYTFLLKATCFCPLGRVSPVVIEVRDGKATSVTYVGDNPPDVFYPELFEEYNTIEKLFAKIQEWIEKGPESFAAEYDEEFGYAKGLSVDPRKNVFDDEFYFRVDNFEMLKTQN